MRGFARGGENSPRERPTARERRKTARRTKSRIGVRLDLADAKSSLTPILNFAISANDAGPRPGCDDSSVRNPRTDGRHPTSDIRLALPNPPSGSVLDHA